MNARSLKIEIRDEDATRFTEYDGHKRLVRIHEQKSGLEGVIALHNTNLGPPIGGTRYWRYQSADEGIRDALRLSRAMTYKCAIAGVPFGGGKAVLFAPQSENLKTDEYLITYTNALKLLGEPFFTGEDVGLTEHDIGVLEEHSDMIVGRPTVGGLPGRWAALSVFTGIEAALQSTTGSPSLGGKIVSIRGIGQVGMELCRLLTEAGAHVVAADINPERIALARKQFPDLLIVDTKDIQRHPADVYSPCALGDEFTAQSIALLAAKIVCGGANNQLASQEAGMLLHKRGILYVPDYVANAGGLISVADELHQGGYSQDRVTDSIHTIHGTVLEMASISRDTDKPMNEVADIIAEKRFKKSLA